MRRMNGFLQGVMDTISNCNTRNIEPISLHKPVSLHSGEAVPHAEFMTCIDAYSWLYHMVHNCSPLRYIMLHGLLPLSP